MIRLVTDKPRCRWGDPITVRYEGDLDDLGTWTNVRGTMQVADSLVRVALAMTGKDKGREKAVNGGSVTFG